MSHAEPNSLLENHPHLRLVFGEGCVAQVGEQARELGATKALLVTDLGIVAAGHSGRVQDLLEVAGIEVTVFDRSKENPTTACVDECAALAREAGIDFIIGLGGGSSMDTAKGANFILTNGGAMKDYWGVGKASQPMLPSIMIPTTAGTGSECQSFALISDDATHAKMACGDPKAMAKLAKERGFPAIATSNHPGQKGCPQTCTTHLAIPLTVNIGPRPGERSDHQPEGVLWRHRARGCDSCKGAALPVHRDRHCGAQTPRGH